METKKIVINTQKNSNSKNLVIIGLTILIFIMFNFYLKEKSSKQEQVNLIEASSAELIKWKTKNGENVAKIKILETTSTKTFLDLKTKDSTIIKLQKLVKENRKKLKEAKGAAAIIESETNIDAKGETIVIIEKDSIFPTYKSVVKDDWFTAAITAKKDSTRLQFNTKHSLSLILGTESQGFLKKRKPYAIAKDNNPYSDIKDMKVYNVIQETKRFAWGPYGGVGIDSNFNINGQIGLGIIYKWGEF